MLAPHAMLAVAISEARLGLAEGGIPIGAAIFNREGDLLGSGHNRRIQHNDPSAHGETDAFRNAGRQRSYRDLIMVTTLAPCWYCTGLIRQFGFRTVIIGESQTFAGGIHWLRDNGIEVHDLASPECIDAHGRLHPRQTRNLERGHRRRLGPPIARHHPADLVRNLFAPAPERAILWPTSGIHDNGGTSRCARQQGQRPIVWTIAVVWALLSPWAYGQDPKTEIQNRLNSQFVLTRFTADHTDILKAGSVLVLQKEPLLMFTIEYRYPPTNVYKYGRFSLGFETSLNVAEANPQRRFVAGEKFWLASAIVQDDAVYLLVISDPFNDVRYDAKIKFPFNKKALPSADEMMKTIAEVVTIDSGDQNAAQQQQPAQQQKQPPAQASTPGNLAPIAPPPPPADAPPPAPKTISIGQTREVVIAIFGQPKTVVNLGAKEIDVYPDMKVTYVNNKVSTVQ